MKQENEELKKMRNFDSVANATLREKNTKLISRLSTAENDLKIARDKISKLKKKVIRPIQPNIIQPILQQPPILEQEVFA